jgi:hypothetical protein
MILRLVVAYNEERQMRHTWLHGKYFGFNA